MTPHSDADRRRPRRKLTEEERRLWAEIAKSVRPLRRARIPAEAEPAETATLAEAPGPPPPATAAVKPKRARPSAPPPRLAPLARREKQRLSRGRTEIDARIDLHGMTQAQAYAALSRFLIAAQAGGAKFVLVITGKGGAEGRPGVLRRQVPLWLALPSFRDQVLGFETANLGHGGEGALYVRIRRRGSPCR